VIGCLNYAGVGGGQGAAVMVSGEKSLNHAELYAELRNKDNGSS